MPLNFLTRRKSIKNASKDAGGKNQNSDKNSREIITKIVQGFKDRSVKEIDNWKNAIAMAEDAENQTMHPLQDLYDDLSKDAHLHAAIQLRKMATISGKSNIADSQTGDNDEELTALFKTQWFHEFTHMCLDSIFYGVEIAEFLEFNGSDIKVKEIPRRNILPLKKQVLYDVTKDEGVQYDDPYFDSWIIEIGKDNDLGLMNKIIPQLIWKKNALQSWAEFAEKFGMPMVTATSNKKDQKEIDRIEELLLQLGEAATAVMPEGTTIDIKETSKDDAYNVFDKLVIRSNSEISKAILGGTMILDDGSSRSQSEVHEKNFDSKIGEADRMFLEFTVNNKLIPLLKAHGYNFKDGSEFKFDRTQSIPIKDHWGIVKDAMQFYEIPEEWVSKTFHFPIEGKRKETSTGDGGQRANFNKPLQNAGAGAEGTNFPKYHKPKWNYTSEGNGFAETSKILGKAQELLNKNLYGKKDITAQQAQKASEVGKLFRDGLFKAWGKRRLEIDYDSTDHKALAMMELNLFHFANAREQASVFELNKLLIDPETKKLMGYSEFKKLAAPHLKNVNENWLRTEYNFTVATGQNASAYHQHLSEINDIPYFQYITVGDSNVRDNHRQLHGKIFSLHDKEARKLYAPNGHGCRCENVQYPHEVSKSELMSGKEGIGILWSKQKDLDKFAVNRGDAGEVFLQNQFYIDGEKNRKQIRAFYDKLDYGMYGFKKWTPGNSKYKGLKLDKTITPENVRELFKPEKGKKYMGFKDYLNRAVTLLEQDFKSHTQGVYVNDEYNRHQLFPFVNEILAQPDEVYLNFDRASSKEQIRYVKFYRQNMLVVNARLDKSNLCVKNWYIAKRKNGDPNGERTGLNIK